MRPNRKLKKPDSSPKLILKEVIGLTTKNANRLASNISNPNCVYVAGCVVMGYNVELDTQSHLVVSNRTPKPLSCVAMSKDGSFFAAGESRHQTAVLAWDCASLASLSELKNHQYGVASTAFSPDDSNMEFAVTVGQDKKINAFNTATGKLIRSFKQDGDIADPVKVNVDPSCTAAVFWFALALTDPSACMTFQLGRLLHEQWIFVHNKYNQSTKREGASRWTGVGSPFILSVWIFKIPQGFGI